MRFLSALLVFSLLTVPFSALAQDLNNPLPHGMTEKELQMLPEYNRISELQTSARSAFGEIRKPGPNIYTPAEFDRADGVCFSWAGYTSLLKQLIKEVAKSAKAYVGVSSYSLNSCKRDLESYGVNMDNVEFVTTSLDSVWMRDYGPWFIYTEDGDREIIDTKYNRPRPYDDKFPITIAQKLNVPYHTTKLISPGGNMIFDGHGVYICTDVVFDPSQGGDPNLSETEYRQIMKDYFGAKKVIIIDDMQRDGTGHVDMFCKLLDDRNLIVGEYKSPSDGAGDNYNILNRNAARLANETNGLGQKFIVHRIPMPKYSNYTSFSHTNSTIINKTVLVPIFNRGTDDEALGVYRSILPGYTVKGYDCNSIITANGAIHCITKLVMSDPLKVTHTPVTSASRNETITINANVDTNKTLKEEGVTVYYATSPEGPFAEATMSATGDGNYTAEIPEQRSTVYYYINAELENGMYETYPEDAPVAEVLRIDID